ncbi:unnamed protein product [Cuscuta campestris]|uniref:CCHC-type domain-containing protein n=1 Tax=Cuscuta campestris TaxID=132261 RepID=A0A484NK44_9ASTE|nr:unnamed protein product [Cuscuta campestris]
MELHLNENRKKNSRFLAGLKNKRGKRHPMPDSFDRPSELIDIFRSQMQISEAMDSLIGQCLAALAAGRAREQIDVPQIILGFLNGMLKSDFPNEKSYILWKSRQQPIIVPRESTRSLKMESSKVGIEKFDGSDFGFWKMQIEDYLYQKDLHEPLTGVKPDSMTEEQWKLKDRQALGMIRLTLTKNVAFNIVKENTTAGLMKALSNMYEKPSAMNKVYLMRRLFNLQMPESGSVANHINDFNMIVSQLCSVEINFEDEIKALILLSSMPESWDTVNVAFNIVKENTTAGLMKALSNMYEKPSAMNKVYLMRRLFNLQMPESGSVANHINDFNMIVSQLCSVEINFEDEIKALILLSSMLESWDTVVAAISSSRGSEKLRFDEIRDVVLSESIRKREMGDSSGSALSVDQKGRSKFKGQHQHGRSKSKNRGKSPNRSNITCWNCGDKGHFKADCKKPKKKQNQKSGDDGDSVNSAEDIGDALILSVAQLNPGFWILVHPSIRHQARSCSKISNLEILERFWDDKNKKILRHCDVTFDESILYKDREQKVPESTKQVGVEVELEKSTPINVEAETQPTPDTIDEEPEVEQVTPEQVLRRSSRISRVPDRVVQDLGWSSVVVHYRCCGAVKTLMMLAISEMIGSVSKWENC